MTRPKDSQRQGQENTATAQAHREIIPKENLRILVDNSDAAGDDHDAEDTGPGQAQQLFILPDSQ